MTEQEQQEPRSYRIKQLHVRRLLHEIERIQRIDQSKGMIIHGSKGVGKSIGVGTFLNTKQDV
jgi:hypothetical protein